MKPIPCMTNDRTNCSVVQFILDSVLFQDLMLRVRTCSKTIYFRNGRTAPLLSVRPDPNARYQYCEPVSSWHIRSTHTARRHCAGSTLWDRNLWLCRSRHSRRATLAAVTLHDTVLAKVRRKTIYLAEHRNCKRRAEVDRYTCIPRCLLPVRRSYPTRRMRPYRL